MFAFKYLLSLSAILAVQAVATPTTRNFPCLSDAEAKNQANHFAELVRSYSNSSADAYLTPDFVDYSDSVIQLMNGGCPNNPRQVREHLITLPLAAPQAHTHTHTHTTNTSLQLGTATFTSRQAFKDAEGNQPAIPFEILKVW